MSVSQQLAPAAGLSLSEPSQPSRCPSSRQQGPSPKPRSVPAHASNGAVQGAAPAAGGTTAQEHGSAGRGCLSPFGDARRPRPRGPAAADTQHMSLRANPGGAVQCSRGAPRCAGQGPARPRATGPRVRCGCSRRGKKKSLARRLGTVPVPRDPPAIRVTERRGGSGWDTNNILYASTKHGDGGW